MADRELGELAGVLFLTGPPGAGKSSVAHALMKRRDRALHIDVDTLRGFVRGGFADPTQEWGESTREQFRLARTAAKAIAEIYVPAGYLAIIDDMVVPSNPDLQLWSSTPLPILGRIVLLPQIAVALDRNAGREDRGEVTERLESLIPPIAQEFRAELPSAPEWTAIDNSALTVDETTDLIETILRRG